jgi:hypothetical protein
VDAEAATAAVDWLASDGTSLPLSALLADPADRELQLRCVPLLWRRDGDERLVPAGSDELQAGDEILFAGTHEARARQELILQNANALAYVLFGREAQSGWLWGWLMSARKK